MHYKAYSHKRLLILSFLDEYVKKQQQNFHFILIFWNALICFVKKHTS